MLSESAQGLLETFWKALRVFCVVLERSEAVQQRNGLSSRAALRDETPVGTGGAGAASDAGLNEKPCAAGASSQRVEVHSDTTLTHGNTAINRHGPHRVCISYDALYS